jgi:ACS family tartrate transporter-like MFS transporter
VGFAIINSVGDISGYVTPQLVGIIRDYTGSYEVPMMIASLFMLAAAGWAAPRTAARMAAQPVV